MERLKHQESYCWIKNRNRYRNHDLPVEIVFGVIKYWVSSENRYLKHLADSIVFTGSKSWNDQNGVDWFGIDKNGKLYSFPSIPDCLIRTKIQEKMNNSFEKRKLIE